jgi:hypothetical protein
MSPCRRFALYVTPVVEIGMSSEPDEEDQGKRGSGFGRVAQAITLRYSMPTEL